MSPKLYYEDAYLKTFFTTILKQEEDDSGRWYVVLQETAFYPTGGGQPHDTGTLNNQYVSNVEEVDGEIRHYIDNPIDSTKTVEGKIDWERRFDHMQQHAGQHILSAAFEELFDFKTISFHLGKDLLTIDLEIEDLSEENIRQAEALANQIVLEGRPIETKWISKEELSQYRLRKQVAVEENIRLVIIPEFDYNGCGGTHPSFTSQVGSIKILGWERQGKKVRVEFICGNRVITQLHQKHRILTELSQLVSAPESDLSQTVQRLLENMKQQDKLLEETREKLLQYEAKEIIENNIKEDIGSKIISKSFENRPVQELQKIARHAVNILPEGVVLLVSKMEGNRLQFVCASGTGSEANMKELVANVLPLINGKGGGNNKFAQGGGEALLSADQLLEKMLKEVLM